MNIQHIDAWAVYDSRGRPTIACAIKLSDGSIGIAMVPSGASTGQKEAYEARDSGQRLGGYAIDMSIKKITDVLAPQLLHRSFDSQSEFDNTLIKLDGHELKRNHGANVSLALSVAFAKSQANRNHSRLFEYLSNCPCSCPIPWFNFINGGAHVSGGMSIQEFMIVPHGFNDFSHAMEAAAEIYMKLKKMLISKGHQTLVGDEGGYAPALKKSEEALDLLCEAVVQSGFQLGKDISLALDVAASEFYKKQSYHVDEVKHSPDQWVEHVACWVKNYPILSIEDVADEYDWETWQLMMNEFGDKVWLIGDDLFATQTKYIQEGVQKNAANGVLIKPNQVGTLTETANAVVYAKENGLLTMISHRSGDTEDTFISDCAVAWGIDGIKSGACARSERTAKYNRLLSLSHLYDLEIVTLKKRG